MNTNEICFMVTAQTLHMGKTASILFTTQQAVSDNIRRLENQHNVKLFYRKPKLTLTPEGRILLKALERIQEIENQLQSELNQHTEIAKKKRIRFGVGTYRVHMALVELILEFNQNYPDIRLDILYEESLLLEEKLLRGEIDIFTGFTVSDHPYFNKEILCQEEPALVVTKAVLDSHFVKEEIRCFLKKGISLRDVERLPFIANNPHGNLWKHYEEVMNREGYVLNVIASSNDYNKILQLCATNFGVAFCPTFLQNPIDQINATTNQFNHMYLIPFNDFHEGNRLDVVFHKNRPIDEETEFFIQLIKKHMLYKTKSSV